MWSFFYAGSPRPQEISGRAASRVAVLAFLLAMVVAFALGIGVGARLGPPARAPQAIADDFHTLYYGSSNQTWENTFWLGIPTQKCPLDLFVFQEIIYETRPDLIVEAGTYKGGSALFFASVLDLLHRGRVVTIDIQDQEGKPQHERITYLLGSSVSPQIAEKVKSLIQPQDKVMVVLDSNHTADHVLRELRTYGPLVTQGNYLIVEDTNVNGHPVAPSFGPGPMEAIDQFFRENSDFVSDRKREKFMLTFNPRGYLRKVR